MTTQQIPEGATPVGDSGGFRIGATTYRDIDAYNRALARQAGGGRRYVDVEIQNPDGSTTFTQELYDPADVPTVTPSTPPTATPEPTTTSTEALALLADADMDTRNTIEQSRASGLSDDFILSALETAQANNLPTRDGKRLGYREAIDVIREGLESGEFEREGLAPDRFRALTLGVVKQDNEREQTRIDRINENIRNQGGGVTDDGTVYGGADQFIIDDEQGEAVDRQRRDANVQIAADSFIADAEDAERFTRGQRLFAGDVGAQQIIEDEALEGGLTAVPDAVLRDIASDPDAGQDGIIAAQLLDFYASADYQNAVRQAGRLEDDELELFQTPGQARAAGPEAVRIAEDEQVRRAWRDYFLQRLNDERQRALTEAASPPPTAADIAAITGLSIADAQSVLSGQLTVSQDPRQAARGPTPQVFRASNVDGELVIEGDDIQQQSLRDARIQNAERIVANYVLDAYGPRSLTEYQRSLTRLASEDAAIGYAPAALGTIASFTPVGLGGGAAIYLGTDHLLRQLFDRDPASAQQLALGAGLFLVPVGGQLAAIGIRGAARGAVGAARLTSTGIGRYGRRITGLNDGPFTFDDPFSPFPIQTAGAVGRAPGIRIPQGDIRIRPAPGGGAVDDLLIRRGDPIYLGRRPIPAPGTLAFRGAGPQLVSPPPQVPGRIAAPSLAPQGRPVQVLNREAIEQASETIVRAERREAINRLRDAIFRAERRGDRAAAQRARDTLRRLQAEDAAAEAARKAEAASRAAAARDSQIARARRQSSQERQRQREAQVLQRQTAQQFTQGPQRQPARQLADDFLQTTPRYSGGAQRSRIGPEELAIAAGLSVGAAPERPPIRVYYNPETGEVSVTNRRGFVAYRYNAETGEYVLVNRRQRRRRGAPLRLQQNTVTSTLAGTGASADVFIGGATAQAEAPATIPSPDPTRAPSPVGVPLPDLTPDTSTVPEIEQEPDFATGTDIEQGVGTQTQTDTQTITDTDTRTGVETTYQTTTSTDLATGTQTQTVTETVTDVATGTRTVTETVTDLATGTQTVTQVVTNTVTGEQTITIPRTVTRTQPATQTVTQTATGIEAPTLPGEPVTPSVPGTPGIPRVPGRPGGGRTPPPPRTPRTPKRPRRPDEPDDDKSRRRAVPIGGQHIEKVAWKQGFGFITFDTDTGGSKFTLENPGVPDIDGAGSADDTYRILTFDHDAPTDRELDMGIVSARVSDVLKYRAKPRARKSRKGGKRKSRR